MNNYVWHEEGIKSWTKEVPFESQALEQAKKLASLPFIYKHVAIMPDVHLGVGATIGSVVPTSGAVIPAAVGVDLGCGMMAIHTSLSADDLPHSLEKVRSDIERAVPHGNKGGSWTNAPAITYNYWNDGIGQRFDVLCEKHKELVKTNNFNQLGTLGGGNHFIEVCLDENNEVWVMLHSGSRGVGNRIGRLFIERAKKDMERHFIHLPDKDLSYLVEGSENFDDYVEAVAWAQDYARINRVVMMKRVMDVLRKHLKPFNFKGQAVNCHHNYIEKENHFNKNVWVTRKGAVRAREGDLGIIPGSMGAKSFIVRGKGNEDSFHSCSHGAGRIMSRSEAKKLISVEDHVEATKGVECRKDSSVVDESPAAYKDIDAVMRSQSDLVEIVHTLKQVVCVKG